jgi:Zn-dependent M16 (insulinase) family peptidase
MIIQEKYRDFVVTKVTPIRELQCTLRELLHIPTGAVIMHIENDDPENLFCLSFETLPTSSNGAPHILEHTVLCGSRKYPVKDPFFGMTRRSLNTFMNALTGADFTCYPAASQVEKDFYNLLNVYLDAVFHPQLKEMSFLQEGHRLEFSDPKDPHTPLQYKGIVYNEMKGSMASPDARLWHALMAELMPDLPYAHNSGGTPEEIPNLTYAQLIEFHETYYHPSRCLFFFYGNFPLKKHLDYLTTHVFLNLPGESPLPPIPLQRRFTSPKQKVLDYPVSDRDNLEHLYIVAFAWLTLPVTAQDELLALAVLDCALMDTDASPLTAHLLASNLCLSADALLDTEMSEVPYCIICKGCKGEKIEELEECLKKGLQKIAEEGIPKYLIDAALHQMEFARTEITGDQAPFGLTLFMRAGLAKQHGCPAENALTIHALFDQLLRDIEDPEFCKKLIKKYFLENAHFVRLVMRPDPELTAREAEHEKEKIYRIQQKLSLDDLEKILQQADDLARYQAMAETQTLDCLPKVTLSDIPPYVRNFPLQQKQEKSIDIFYHESFTNQILYSDLIFDLPQLSPDQLPYMQLLFSLLPELGMGERLYAENLEYLQAHTGGLHFSYALYSSPDSEGGSAIQPSIRIRGKALARKADRLLTLMKDAVTSARFDEESRVAELIQQNQLLLRNRLLRNAARYAVLMSQSGLSEASAIHNICHGLPYYYAVGAIAERVKKEPEQVIEFLQNLYQRLFAAASRHLVITCDSQLYGSLQKEDYYGLNRLPKGSPSPWKSMDYPPCSSQARIIASPVAFNAEAFSLPSYFHPDAPALDLAARLFYHIVLHPGIREQGGAYGTGATYNPLIGQIVFSSYRDPHISLSRQIFRNAIETIAEGKFTPSNLEETKLQIVQDLYAPTPPGQRGITEYTHQREGLTPTVRQYYRDRVLAMTKDEVAEAVKAHLLSNLNNGVFVSFAGEALLKKEKIALNAEGKFLESFTI